MDDKEKCLTGACTDEREERDADTLKLSEGSGGREMQELIGDMRSLLGESGAWQHADDDAASVLFEKGRLVFTTDSYVVTPIFFPGGNIGKIAFCGTINDLAVMGAQPLGISLGLILEEGFSKKELFAIIETIGALSKEHSVPVVTGDTKVMEKGSLDKIIINTSGVGRADDLLAKPLSAGDKIIVSGGIGEHGSALLAKRFELETSIRTDSKPLWEEIRAINGFVKQARDITRGGLAAALNEMAGKNGKQFLIYEEEIPIGREVRALTEILGIDLYSLACEGRFVAIVSPEKSGEAVKALKKYNASCAIVGEVREGEGVAVKTRFGRKILHPPSGTLVPRIC